MAEKNEQINPSLQRDGSVLLPKQTLAQRLGVYFTPKKMWEVALVTDIRYWISAGLVCFCLALIFTVVVNDDLKSGLHPAPALILWWFMMFYLSCLEGVQAALVALTPIDPEVYKDTHPACYKCTTLCFKGNNLDKFIVGRQFLVVFVVFMIGYCTGYDNDKMNPTTGGSGYPFGVDEGFMNAVMKPGFAGALTTIVIAQLISQIVASRCNIDYLNYYFHYYVVIGICLLMEFTGLMHAVYLVQKAVVSYRGTPEAKAKQIENQGNPFFFWGRVVFSLGSLGLCLAIIFDSLFKGATGLADMVPSIPNGVGVVIFFALCIVVHCTEGLQVALFAMQKMNPEEWKVHAGATANGAVAFAGDNLQRFLIGRQALTAMSMFFLSLVCSVQANVTEDQSVKAANGTIYTVQVPWTALDIGSVFSGAFVETGLVGAVTLTIVASLSGQVIASAFPLGFCGFPFMWITLYACLLVEFTGICHFSWPLADGIQAAMGDFMQDDDVYLKHLKPAPVTLPPADSHIISPGEAAFLVASNDLEGAAGKSSE